MDLNEYLDFLDELVEKNTTKFPSPEDPECGFCGCLLNEEEERYGFCFMCGPHG